MFHYFGAITNTSGDSLIGYFARVVDPATQNTVTIAADYNGTPIVTVSGVENAAATDAYGNLDFYVAPGTYHLDIYAPNATSLILRVQNVSMNSTKGDPGDPGPKGDTGEGLDDVMAPSGSSLVGFRQAGTAAVVRTVQDVARDRISVKDFGAKGDGSTNDTAAFTAANIAAAANGKDLFLPAGIYMVDAEREMLVSWFGEYGTRVKYRGAAPAFTRLVFATGKNGIVSDGIIYDGNVSADPGAWSNSNYDSFTGASGLSIENCIDPVVRNCRGENTRQHGFRFLNCTNPLWERCITKRSRGAFGDGFIALSNIRPRSSFCHAEDFTRIGHVFDSLGANILTTYKMVLVGLTWNNGHDASVMYGGGEFNAGIWCEHAADTEMVACEGDNTTHRGINFCTGSSNNGLIGIAKLTMLGCRAGSTSFGIQTYSLGSVPLHATIIGCSTKQALTAFEADAASGQDIYRWIGCHADYNASSGTGRGFVPQTIGALTTKPLFEVIDCTVSRWAETLANLDDSGDQAVTADVGAYGIDNGVMTATRLIVRNLKHVDSTKPVYIRVYGAFAHEVDISGCDLFMRRGGCTGGFMVVHDNVLRGLALNYNGFADMMQIHDNQVRGRLTVQGTDIQFNDNDVRHTDESNVALLSDSTGKRPAITLSGNKWRKGINMYGPALQLGAGSQTFGAVIGGDVVYNDGPSSASLPFAARATGVTCTFNGLLLDDTVVNTVAINDTQASPEILPTGVRKVAMH